MVAEAAMAAEYTVDPVLRDGYEVHQAALRRGLNVLLLPRQVMMVSTPDGDELSFVHGVPSTSTLSAVTFAQDKRMRRARLTEEGLPVPRGGTFSIAKGVGDAKKLINRIGYPVVIKPAMGDNMIEVHADLRDEAAVDQAIDYLRTHVDERPTYVKSAYALTLLGEPDEVDGRRTVPRSYRFLVEKQITGHYLRFLVIRGRVASVVHCPHGPRDPKSAIDVTHDVHASLVTLARDAVRAVAGLAVAAVDIVVSKDYESDTAKQEAIIVELSERPWLATQVAISEDLGHALGDEILNAHLQTLPVALPEIQNDAELELSFEGMTDAEGGLAALSRVATSLGAVADLAVTDRVEGLIQGTMSGDVRTLAYLCERLLDGQIDGHKAMLIEQRHRSGRSRATIAVGTRQSQMLLRPRAWTADILSTLLDGRWENSPRSDWSATSVATRRAGVKSSGTLFIAIDRETWLRGTGNTGIYATWKDTHELVPKLGEYCVGAIAQRADIGLPSDFPLFVMADTYSAIRTMAEYARDNMTGKVVAITGTVGKSTVKDMLADVLTSYGDVIATRGNENTRTGVPLTLTNCISDPEFCVLEVAQSALWSESGGVCLLARPHVAVVTEIGITQARRVSSEEMTAEIKARVAQGIVPGGTAVLNRDMAKFDLVRQQVEKYGARVVTYGFGSDADVRVISHDLSSRGSHAEIKISDSILDFRVNMLGKGMLANAVAVLTVASELGIDLESVASRLDSFTLRSAKLDETEHGVQGGVVAVIDDSYSAAPLSMLHAFEVLGSYQATGRRVAVLGRMVDLGDKSAELHQGLAEPLLRAGVDLVITHGDEMRHLREALPEDVLGPHCMEASECAEVVAERVGRGDVVLVKGSRRASDFGTVGRRLRSILG